MQGQVVTNKVYNVNGENQRLLQIEITSGLLENKFPIKLTNISTDVNDDIKNIEVAKRGTYATNNDNFDIQSNWDKQQKKFDINILNQEIDGKVQWNKNQSDKILLTYILDENNSMIGKSIEINARVELYDNTVIEKDIVVNVTDEIDGGIYYEISSPEELYKGNLYYGEETKIESKSEIDIR